MVNKIVLSYAIFFIRTFKSKINYNLDFSFFSSLEFFLSFSFSLLLTTESTIIYSSNCILSFLKSYPPSILSGSVFPKFVKKVRIEFIPKREVMCKNRWKCKIGLLLERDESRNIFAEEVISRQINLRNVQTTKGVRTKVLNTGILFAFESFPCRLLTYFLSLSVSYLSHFLAAFISRNSLLRHKNTCFFNRGE